MGNLNSNQLVTQEKCSNNELSVPILDKGIQLAFDNQTQSEDSSNLKRKNVKDTLNTKESIKKRGSNNADNMLLNQEDLLPKGFSSLDELKKLYLVQKENKKKMANELCEWDTTVFAGGKVTCLTVTKDDKYLIAATNKGLITIFELATKQAVCRFKDEARRNIQSISVSEDNHCIVAAIQKDIKVFNLKEKLEMFCLKDAHNSKILSILLGKNYIITGAEDCSIKMFDLLSGKEVHHFVGIHKGPIFSLALLNNNESFVSASGDGSVKIFDLNAKKEIYQFSDIHKGAISSIAISHDNDYLITGSDDSSIKVFSLKTKEQIYHFNHMHKSLIVGVAISKDNKYVYSVSKDSAIMVWDLEKNQDISLLKGVQSVSTSMALSNNGKHIFVGSEDSFVLIFDIESKEKQYLEDLHKDWILSIVISKDNRYIISGSKDGCIKLFDLLEKKQLPQFFSFEEESISSLAISSSNKYFVSGSKKCVRLFSLESMKLIHEFPHPESFEKYNNPVAISNDERFIVSGYRNSLRIFDLEKLQQVREICLESSVQAMCLSHEAKYIIVGLDDKSIKVFDFNSSNEVFHSNIMNGFHYYNLVITLTERLLSITISQDNKYIISGHQDSIRVFSLQTKQLISELHIKGPITSIAITKDNRHIISTCNIKLIKVWDLETKQEIHCYKNLHDNIIGAIALSNDNQYIASGSSDGLQVMRMNINQQALDLETSIKNEQTNYVGISDECGFIVLAFYRGFAVVFDIHTREKLYELSLKSRCNKFALSSNSSYLAGCYQNQIWIYDLASKEEEYCFQIPQENLIRAIAASRDGKYIAVIADSMKSIFLFDVKNREKKWEIKNPQTGDSIVISNNNKYVFSGDMDGNIQAYDLLKGQLLYCLNEAQNKGISALAISNYDEYLIAGSNDGSLKVFDLESVQEVIHLEKAHSERIYSIAASSNGKFFVSGSKSSIKIFDIHTGIELNKFRLGGHSVSISKDGQYVYAKQSVLPTFKAESTGLNYVSSKISNTSVFDGYDDFLTLLWPKDTETQKRFLSHYLDMYILPYHWTVLHLLAIFNPSAISHIPQYSQFKVPFILDSYGKTPLHYLLAQNHDFSIINNVLKYILDYLEDTSRATAYEYQRICASLSNCCFFIISKASPSLKHRYLNACYPETSSQYNQEIPSFGVSSQKYVFSNIPVMHSEILSQLHEEGDERVVLRTNMIALDYDPRSDDMLTAAHVLTEIEQETIFKLPIVENLIDHLWESTIGTMNMTALLFSGLMILISLYIGQGQRALYLEVSIIILTTLFFIEEVVQMTSLGVEYLKSFWNWVDLTQIVLTLIFIFSRFGSSGEIIGEAWMVSTIIIAGYLRWLSYLRLFTPTRILIEIIIAVLYDMLGFITVIASILVGFSLIFLEFNRSQSASIQEHGSYGFHFYNTFKLLFGNYDDSDYTLSQTVLVSFLLCILNVVLLNLLIAIIGDSYGKVQEGRDLVDAKTRLDMIQEAMILMRRIMPKKNLEKKYLIYRLPAVVEEENLENKEWNARIDKIEKSLKQNKEEDQENIKNEMRNLGEQVEQIKTEVNENVKIEMKKMEEVMKKEVKGSVGMQVDQLTKRLEEEVLEIKKEIRENVEQKVEQVKEEMKNMSEQVDQIKNDIQGLKDLIGVVLTNLNEVTKTIKSPSST